ncbi:hypothetical protein LEP1GSC038_3551 [Leptospira weilii str. 2006001855]|uniref:Uncharacterized protein n=2 Tax=Leptospira weilii TaxID=28184 RepID=M6Q838_9LEPT|nr:hypothetical protein LEP1GSC038_3551 [Leptospira weilii str. 2006001855]EMN89335.1 hypothetical protein LEP1GSC108_4523 [Leptospira weilii str. UI 13098]OMI18063.1 hypothetical protein BUQ74_06750 [Leptospira weilii serovar Heyan]
MTAGSKRNKPYYQNIRKRFFRFILGLSIQESYRSPGTTLFYYELTKMIVAIWGKLRIKIGRL